MAFTEEYKDLQSCTHILDKHDKACGQPCFDSSGLSRAQMAYTPIVS